MPPSHIDGASTTMEKRPRAWPIAGQPWEDLHERGLVGVGSPRSGSCILCPRSF